MDEKSKARTDLDLYQYVLQYAGGCVPQYMTKMYVADEHKALLESYDNNGDDWSYQHTINGYLAAP